jgi:hypothetical protein
MTTADLIRQLTEEMERDNSNLRPRDVAEALVLRQLDTLAKKAVAANTTIVSGVWELDAKRVMRGKAEEASSSRLCLGRNDWVALRQATYEQVISWCERQLRRGGAFRASAAEGLEYAAARWG